MSSTVAVEPVSNRRCDCVCQCYRCAGFDVLIASDAIGMGLNLNIKRIIFSTVKKFDGDNMRLATVEEVWCLPSL